MIFIRILVPISTNILKNLENIEEGTKLAKMHGIFSNLTPNSGHFFSTRCKSLVLASARAISLALDWSEAKGWLPASLEAAAAALPVTPLCHKRQGRRRQGLPHARSAGQQSVKAGQGMAHAACTAGVTGMTGMKGMARHRNAHGIYTISTHYPRVPTSYTIAAYRSALKPGPATGQKSWQNATAQTCSTE